MARIISVATAVPKYKVTQDEVRTHVKKLYNNRVPEIDQFLTLFDNTAIETRYFCKPVEWFLQNHTFARRNAVYIEEACNLGERAIRLCLDGAEVDAKEVDAIVFVSTTGLATPSIDTHLINRLNMDQHIKRIPLWGLGCAGGVAGMARAVDATRVNPNSYVLFVAVELCGLTFLKEDVSKSNLVATSLFSEGAAAVLVAGDEVVGKGTKNAPRVRSSLSMLWPNSQEIMGWDVVDEGLKVVFSKEIPSVISTELKPAITHFLNQDHLEWEQVRRAVLHPGGAKVIKAYEEALGLSPEDLKHTSSVLRSYGNMSSPTVVFVLEKEMLESHQAGDLGIMAALGPGFSLEMLLLEW